jgi:hypothetical protein
MGSSKPKSAGMKQPVQASPQISPRVPAVIADTLLNMVLNACTVGIVLLCLVIAKHVA